MRRGLRPMIMAPLPELRRGRRRAAVRFGARRERVQAELVREAADAAGLEAGLDQQRPQVAHFVVHLVVLHLAGRAEAELERRELEESLAAPGRNVDQARAT